MELIKDLGTMYQKSSSTRRYRFGIFKCECGNEVIKRIDSVKRGNIKSCGCLNIRKIKERRTTHGKTNHRLYSVWSDMMQRCNNPKSKAYKNYGERGIKVCDKWLDIRNFIDDMYPSFKEGLSIDRIDNDGNYESSNCRWADWNTQLQNTKLIRSTNSSGYRGVRMEKRTEKWQSSITHNRKHIHLGTFNTAEEAAKARDAYIVDNDLQHTRNFK